MNKYISSKSLEIMKIKVTQAQNNNVRQCKYCKGIIILKYTLCKDCEKKTKTIKSKTTVKK